MCECSKLSSRLIHFDITDIESAHVYSFGFGNSSKTDKTQVSVELSLPFDLVSYRAAIAL